MVCYANGQKMREVLPKAELLPKTFSRNGFRKVRHEVGRSGAGLMPCSFRVLAIVEGATRWLSFLSSPWILQ